MNRRYFALIVLFSLLALRNDASSQILFDPGNAIRLGALDCSWTNATFTFSETNGGDFPGRTTGGQAYKYSLLVELPAGFAFNPNTGSIIVTNSQGSNANVVLDGTISLANGDRQLVVPLKGDNHAKPITNPEVLSISGIQVRISGTPCPTTIVSGMMLISLSYYNSPGLFDPSQYGISNNGSLPVELTSFTAMLRNETIALKWSTATETNNYGFDVERSFDRENWEKIGFVAGSGTTSSQRDYTFDARLTHRDMQQEILSFRLRQIDRDGSIDYSPEVSVSPAVVAGTIELKQNFPNPFNPATNISFNLPASDVVSLSVYNELGVEVARIHDGAQLERGWHTASFNATELPSGLYMYRLQTSAGTSSRTMMLMK